MKSQIWLLSVSFLLVCGTIGCGKSVERIIDLRPGDDVWHEPGKRAYLLRAIEAYRDNHISREQMQADPPTEGYVVRGSWGSVPRTLFE